MEYVNFTNVGGLKKNIQCIKETIIFPLLYPQLREKFHLRPPQGILFYGPPGILHYSPSMWEGKLQKYEHNENRNKTL